MTNLKSKLEYFPFSMPAIQKRFGDDVEYLGIMVTPKINTRVYMFYQPKPNRELGHTEFFGLVFHASNLYVAGFVGEELEAYQNQNVIECQKCKDVIISLDRHDYNTCQCGECMIDGGGLYLRYGGGDNAKLLKINTFTKEVVNDL